jgi:AcrR family transcriptional regulator
MYSDFQQSAAREPSLNCDGADFEDTGVIRRRHLEVQRPRLSSPAVEQIYDAATEAVAAYGLDGLSMEDIAIRAGCSRATVYRRVGGKEAIRDAVLDQAIARIAASVARAVDHLDGEERIITAMIASLDTIRADPVSAALLTGPAAAQSVSTTLITEVTGAVAQLAGLDLSDTVTCELIARVTLSLLCWPAVDRRIEAAIIRRYVSSPARV